MTAPAAAAPIACPDCDLLQHIPPLPPRAKAHCPRCGHILARHINDPRDVPLALTLAAAIILVIANTSHLMSLEAVGRSASTTILGGAWEMWQQGEQLTGALVMFCAVLAPSGYLLFMLTLLLGARRTPAPWWVGEMLRWAHHLQIWSMLEVMMLGILVALIKIAQLASVEAGIGMYAVFALIVLIPAIMVNFDPDDIWHRVEWAAGDTVPPAPSAEPAAVR